MTDLCFIITTCIMILYFSCILVTHYCLFWLLLFEGCADPRQVSTGDSCVHILKLCFTQSRKDVASSRLLIHIAMVAHFPAILSQIEDYM